MARLVDLAFEVSIGEILDRVAVVVETPEWINDPTVPGSTLAAPPDDDGGTILDPAAKSLGNAFNNSLTGTPTDDTISGFDGEDTISGGDGNDTIYGHSSADLDPGSGSMYATLLANVGGGAAFLTGAPGDNGFAYALNKNTGEITRINTATGAQSNFLNIPDAEFSASGEQGVLGLAFHPGYASNGRFFVFLTNASGNLEVREYHSSGGNPPTADAAPVRTIITIPHPTNSNHNGGMLAFGPDGQLYIATGDGGGGNDPNGNSQNLDSLLGKILRIDINRDDFAGDATRNYGIPSDNPFASGPGADEIWAYGLRNPWRMSFDSATGDLYIGDVGQGAREEVDYDPAGGPGGINYGWNFREGRIARPGAPTVPTTGFTDPIFDYPRSVGAAITGGYVYHGTAPGLQGAYFFADFVSGRLMTLRVLNGQAQGFVDHTSHVTGAALGGVASFGTDNVGNLYAVTLSGAIYRLTPGVAAGDGADRLDGGAGNDVLYGGMRNDVLIGGLGNDTLVGGPDSDRMTGGAGADTYYVDSVSDTVDEQSSGGTGVDTVRSSVSFSLSASAHVLGTVENLTLTGAVAIAGTGNAGANVIDGFRNPAANALTGLGGNDIYMIGAGDTVNEAASGGTDTVRSTVTFRLGANVENLTLLNVSNALNGIGNGLVNIITGNEFANVLDGGLLGDTLNGNGGNDVFLYASQAAFTGDIVNGGAGTDRIRFTSATAGQTLTLSNLVTQVEIAEISNSTGGTAGITALNLNALAVTSGMQLIGNNGINTIQGTNFNDTLSGNAGNDTLLGNGGTDTIIGGAGRDTMTGGADNDTFRFAALADSPTLALADVITDFDDSGNDTIDVGALFGALMTYRHDLAFTAAGQVRINDIAGVDLLVEVNTGGTLAADLTIRLANTTLASMTGSDFVL